MALSNVTAFAVVIALVVLTASAPNTAAAPVKLIPTNANSLGFTVTAQFCCSATGNCITLSPPSIGTPVASGTPVSLFCTAGRFNRTIAVGKTGVLGFATIKAPAGGIARVSLPTQPLKKMPCFLTARPANCKKLVGKRVLAPLTLLGVDALAKPKVLVVTANPFKTA